MCCIAKNSTPANGHSLSLQKPSITYKSPKQDRLQKSIAAYKQSLADELLKSDQAKSVGKAVSLMRKPNDHFSKKHKSLSIDVGSGLIGVGAKTSKVSPQSIKFP
jgi:hypothetical protein